MHDEVLAVRVKFEGRTDFVNKCTRASPRCPACGKHKMDGGEYSYREILQHAEDIAYKGRKGGKKKREAHGRFAQRLGDDDIKSICGVAGPEAPGRDEGELGPSTCSHSPASTGLHQCTTVDFDVLLSGALQFSGCLVCVLLSLHCSS